jgi:hypothetical protein
MTAPEAIKPTTSTVKFKGETLNHPVPPYTIQVIDIPLK